MNKHILVIAQYFYPEQFRINDICAEWIKRKYRVTVVTGIPNYPQGKFYDGYGLFKKRTEVYDGIEIIRIPLIPRGKSSVMLILNYASFVVSGFFWSLFTKIKADIVFIFEVSPMTQALPGVWYSKKLKIPCFIYVTDLWPENVEYIANIKSKRILTLIGRMVDYIYKNCTKIFTSSKSFIESIHKRGISENKLEFWPQYAEDFYKPINKENVNMPDIPQDGAFNIIFAGNIGVAQGLDVLPETTVILKQKNINVRFNIVGDGRYKSQLIALIEQLDVADMFNFISKQPATKIPEYMAVCDAALVCLAKSEVFSLTLPAKMQSCLACGIAIIGGADGEIQDVIREADAGVFCKAGDAEELSKIIEDLVSKSPNQLSQLAQNGLEYSKKYYDKETLLNKMDTYFSEFMMK